MAAASVRNLHMDLYRPMMRVHKAILVTQLKREPAGDWLGFETSIAVTAFLSIPYTFLDIDPTP